MKLAGMNDHSQAMTSTDWRHSPPTTLIKGVGEGVISGYAINWQLY